MKIDRVELYSAAVVLSIVLLLSGCSKKVAKVTPPPPPSPAAPTATLAANPSMIQQGQSTTLTWTTTNASQIKITGRGTVSASGSQTVTPSASTTYTLQAEGAGGSQEASARVTVNPAAAKAMSTGPTEAELFARNVHDVYFDFNKADVRQDQVPNAQNSAQFLTQHPDLRVVIEGHCDDRGSEEYNLALGASRANSLKDQLTRNGVPASQVTTVSYGKEKPFCSDQDEQCWQQNRRDHFALQQ